MQPIDFQGRQSELLLKTPQGYWAFLPPPLPPPLPISWEMAKQISEADRALGELAGMARNLPNPHLLIRPFMQREAVLSSRIEGTQASLSDLFYFEASGTVASGAQDVQEVANYINALEYGLNRIQNFPLSLRLIREIHQMLLDKVRGQNLSPGEFRTTQNWIGPAGCTLMDAFFVPPPPIDMIEALDAFEKYLHSTSSLSSLVRLALIHYQFEAIHPFLDGNGRIGRLLLSLIFCHEGLLPKPLLYLSAFFEKNRDEYYRNLLYVSQTGIWDPWITFFLKGVSTQAVDAVKRSDRLLLLWNEHRDQVQSARSSALLLRLVDNLFTYPAITTSIASRKLGVTPKSAQKIIDRLIEEGILSEVTGNKRNRLYVAKKIIETLEVAESLP
jgi:Fic family protein